MNEKELQIKLGEATEKYIAKTLRQHGYWVYNMPKKVSGQPCDIVAIKGGSSILVWLIDGKHIRKEDVSFTFDRIEPNQLSAMAYAHDYANISNTNIGFAIFFDRDKKLRWLSYEEFLSLSKEGHKSANLNNLKLFTEVLENANCDQQQDLYL